MVLARRQTGRCGLWRVTVDPEHAAKWREVVAASTLPNAWQHAKKHVEARCFALDFARHGKNVVNVVEPTPHSCARAKSQFDKRVAGGVVEQRNEKAIDVRRPRPHCHALRS